MSPPAYLRVEPGGCLLLVKVQPRAKATAIVGLHGGELKIRISAPPVDSAANELLLEFLSDTLGCGRRQIILARGSSSQHKVIRVVGLDPGTVILRLCAAGATA